LGIKTKDEKEVDNNFQAKEFNDLILLLDNCKSIEVADEFSRYFCHISSKRNRKRLIN